MNQEQLLHDAEEFRILGDGKAASVVRQCRIMAQYADDSAALTKMADILEATRQKLVKYAGCGVIMEAGLMPEDQPLEWGYQLYLFPEEQWETVVDYALFIGLNASELAALRKIMAAGGCPLCLNDETPTSEA